jgi:hypothetical protein
LGERLEQLKDQEENQRRQVAYDKARVERDQLAAELADLYPAFAKKLAKLLSRVATGDREIEFINNHNLPKGTDRPLVAELKARGLAGLLTPYTHCAFWGADAMADPIRNTISRGLPRDREPSQGHQRIDLDQPTRFLCRLGWSLWP